MTRVIDDIIAHGYKKAVCIIRRFESLKSYKTSLNYRLNVFRLMRQEENENISKRTEGGKSLL